MRVSAPVVAAITLCGVTAFARASDATLAQPLKEESSARPSPLPSPFASIPLGSTAKERLAVAKSVRAMTAILGVELGSTLKQAHAKLDQLNDPTRPWQQGKGSSGRKVLWFPAKTEYSSIYVKANSEERIEQIAGFIRPGQELPFEKIGETKKAPVLSDTTVVWDVIRPKRKPMRVMATGKDRKASMLKLFIVPRPVL